MSFLKISDLNAFYGQNHILKNISMNAEKGEFVGIVGNNGCGKTTLLKCICNLLPHKGSIEIGKTPLKTLSPKKTAGLCAYVPSKSESGVDISALEIVLMGFNSRLGLFENPTEMMKKEAQKKLADLNLQDDSHKNYLTLSDGQKHLCLLARGFVAETPLLLLDEPENSLDINVVYHIMNYIKTDTHTNKTLVIASIHDLSLALNYCDRIYLMKEGRLTDCISPKEEETDVINSKLSLIYDNIRICRCEEQFVLIRRNP